MEIRKSKARFISIFFIVALGVAFFSGIQAASPDMRLSGDAYYDSARLMDIKVIGTMGLTKEDVEALEGIDGIQEAEGAYFTDVMCGGEDSQTVLHIESVNETVNQLTPMEGRIPEKSGEIFLDNSFAAEKGYEIGDLVSLSQEEDGLLKKEEFTVVGIGSSPLYISFNRGNTTLGSGKINGFAYVLPEDFDQEVFTQIYIRVHGAEALVSYTDGYDNLIDKITERVKGISDIRCQARYEEVVADANAELDDARKELEDGKKEAEEKLADAKKELEDGEKEYEDGKQEYEDGVKAFDDAKKELEDGRAQLASAKNQVSSGWAQIESAKSQVLSGREQLADGKAQLAAGWEQFQEKKKEFDQGSKALEDAKQQLADGQKEIDNAKAALTQKQKELDAGKAEAAAGRQQIEETRNQLNAQRQQCQDGLLQVQAGEAQLPDGEAALEQARTQLAGLQAQLQGLQAQAETLRSQAAALQAQAAELQAQLEAAKGAETPSEEEIASLEAQIASVEAQKVSAEGQLAALDGSVNELAGQAAAYQGQIDAQAGALEASRQQLAATRSELENGLAAVDAGLSALTEKEAQLDAAEAQFGPAQTKIDEGWQQLAPEEEKLKAAEKEIKKNEKTVASGKEQLDAAQAELEANQAKIDASENSLVQAEAEIAANTQQLVSAQQEIDANEQKLADGEREIKDNEQKLLDAEKELADAEKELEKGKKEYKDAEKDAEKEIADGEKEIEDAQKEIDDLETPEWLVTDRAALPEYSDYGDNADRIRNIGQVFPVIFFLVAALISLTTMTRMVEEQRTQIGTMKALGYGKYAIASKYLNYAFLATVGGSIFGVIVGEKILPYIIIKAYGIMYHNMATSLRIDYEWKFALIASVAAVICTIGAALFSCMKALMETPAGLMRPPAPKEGKRVLIERITIIWKRLNFTWKSSLRNLFRYKKRLFMTIFGIAGSMALMLVGFGIKDSIMDIAVRQYAELQHYEGTIIGDEDASEKEKQELEAYLNGNDKISRYTHIQLTSMTAPRGKSSLSVYVYVPENVETFGEDVTLQDRKSKEPYTLTDEGAVICEKTASLLGLAVGDTMTLEKDHKQYQTKVAAITENYMGHYVYMTPLVYEDAFGEKPDYLNTVFTMKEEYKDQIENVGNEILKYRAALSISYTSSLAGQLDRMLSTLGSVIVVLIVSAGMLAFVVLYNLNNINITERQRELATLKVLGFYDGEVSQYVFRENILLTLIGVLAGAGFGIFLHRFVITTVEVDAVMFGRQIRGISFVYSAVLTCGFSAFVNGVMHFKLKKIDMVESLKSVE